MTTIKYTPKPIRKAAFASCVPTFLFMITALQVQADITTTLYNGSLGTTPEAQGWSYAAASEGFIPFPPTVSAIPISGATVLDSMAVPGDRAGYSNYTPFSTKLWGPELDRATGFSLRFEIMLPLENHLSADRAGFSVILLGSDAKGIELGFWDNEIWAQNDAPGLFTHGEGTPFNTAASRQWFNLAIMNDSYSLSVGADPATATPLLVGAVRDYSAFGSAPYTLNDYLFLGDNTTSAGAAVEIANIELVMIPEPGTFVLLSAGSLGLYLCRKNKLFRVR